MPHSSLELYSIVEADLFRRSLTLSAVVDSNKTTGDFCLVQFFDGAFDTFPNAHNLVLLRLAVVMFLDLTGAPDCEVENSLTNCFN